MFLIIVLLKIDQYSIINWCFVFASLKVLHNTIVMADYTGGIVSLSLK